MYAVTKNTKKLKCRDAVIKEQKETIHSQEKVIKKLKVMESRVSNMKAKLSRLSTRTSYNQVLPNQMNYVKKSTH